jgi:mevalonate kinase
MPAISASAPGKIILFGEHAVVYNRPAIAVPVTQVQARVVALANPRAPAGEVRIEAPDIQLMSTLAHLQPDHPLTVTVQSVLSRLGLRSCPALTLRISSTIPVAAGLGSGAAVAVALIRALSSFLGCPLPDAEVSELAYRTEQCYHGTPSGIDNTVIAYAQPVFYHRGQPLERLAVGRTFTIVIADTGMRSSTAEMVDGVRTAWHSATAHFESLFDQIGSLTLQARPAIATGNIAALGPLMDANHALLKEIGVSCPQLDHLVEAARKAGAAGAKLSGAGGGGNMIALVGETPVGSLVDALRQAGAVWTLTNDIASLLPH